MGEPEVLGISLSLQCWYHRKLFPFVLLWGHAEYREKNTAINVSACSVLTYCWIHWIHMLTTRTTVLIIHLFLSSDFSFISFRHLYTYIVFKYIHVIISPSSASIVTTFQFLYKLVKRCDGREEIWTGKEINSK